MTSSIQEYVDQFVDLIEQLSPYTPNPDNLSYTTRFIDGLRDDIRAIILVQRPPDLDIACTLALLQEEALEPGRRKEIKKPEGFPFMKSQHNKGPLPLPAPPPRPGLPQAPTEKKPFEDRRHPAKLGSVDDKL